MSSPHRRWRWSSRATCLRRCVRRWWTSPSGCLMSTHPQAPFVWIGWSLIWGTSREFIWGQNWRGDLKDDCARRLCLWRQHRRSGVLTSPRPPTPARCSGRRRQQRPDATPNTLNPDLARISSYWHSFVTPDACPGTWARSLACGSWSGSANWWRIVPTPSMRCWRHAQKTPLRACLSFFQWKSGVNFWRISCRRTRRNAAQRPPGRLR